jgi:hypothetical protein
MELGKWSYPVDLFRSDFAPVGKKLVENQRSSTDSDSVSGGWNPHPRQLIFFAFSHSGGGPRENSWEFSVRCSACPKPESTTYSGAREDHHARRTPADRLAAHQLATALLQRSAVRSIYLMEAREKDWRTVQTGHSIAGPL